ncbi:hypothetical protein MXD81_52510 [Microbacteriaceae bacterium K1510]|nr:hypothetical protein [Microbacteriaceae bacterium K1510]
MPVNFTISEAAKRAAEDIRTQYDVAWPDDPAAVMCVAWAIGSAGTALGWEGVMVGFYPRSMLDDVSKGIQHVSGVDLVYFTTREYHGKFEGKVLDFSEQQGFFLRSP